VSLREIVRTVRSHWLAALIAFVVVMAIGLAYVILPAKEYQASVVLVALPPANATDVGSDVGAIQIEIPQIVVEASSPIVTNEVTASVPARYRSVPVTITATGQPASNSVTITAKSTDPSVAQAFANATAARLVSVTANSQAHSVLVLSQLGSAPLPTSPTNPRKTVLAASFVFGLIAAVFAALIAARIGSYVAADEIWEKVGIAVVGEVPKLARNGSNPNPTYVFESADDPQGQEAFQQLRAFLQLMIGDTRPVIAVTSCDSGEGKSTVTAHTAWALANPGHAVAAIDGDLRKPSLHLIFDRPLSPGVSDFDGANLNDLLATTGNPYLEFVASGQPRRHPADVATNDVPPLLRSLQDSNRTVVVDCPPVLGVAETSILVSHADAVLIVVNARKVNFERLLHGIAQLRASGANVAGIVLNRVRRPRAMSAYSYTRPPAEEPQAESLRHKIRRIDRSG
jgi:polysaccharide biosynthesis transport protein